MERLLCAAGYGVLAARDGIEAVELLRRHRGAVAVAVLDLGLPKLSGWESYRAMRVYDPGLKVVFASGYIDPRIKSEIESNRAAIAVVKKPYRPEELIAKITAMARQEAR